MPADLTETPTPLAEISQGPNAFEQFLDRNQKNIVILAILIALGAAAFVIYRGIEKSKQETAGAAFNKADDLAALQAVVTEHADTTAGRSAMILLADRQWAEGQQDVAIETLRKFIAENAGHPGLPTAQASLGSKLMAQGKSADATKVFEDLADDSNSRFIAPFALISLGDISKAAGDLEKAEAAYARVNKDFSDSSFADAATRRIAMLKAKPPVEIPAPPKPEPAPASDPAAAIKSTLPPGITVTPVETPASPPVETPAPVEEKPAPETPPVTPPQEPAPEPGNQDKPAEP